jgi:hypothetical protein
MFEVAVHYDVALALAQSLRCSAGVGRRHEVSTDELAARTISGTGAVHLGTGSAGSRSLARAKECFLFVWAVWFRVCAKQPFSLERTGTGQGETGVARRTREKGGELKVRRSKTVTCARFGRKAGADFL